MSVSLSVCLSVCHDPSPGEMETPGLQSLYDSPESLVSCEQILCRWVGDTPAGARASKRGTR